jgi:hypothetical protein
MHYSRIRRGRRKPKRKRLQSRSLNVRKSQRNRSKKVKKR